MKNQTMIPLVAAGACGLVAVLGIQQYLAAKGEKEVVETATVLVAATPIEVGVRLDELNTKFITVAVGLVPEGAVKTLEEIDERALKVARGANDWILVDQLGEKGGTGASIGIPTGMRVATIPVDATTNHSGMLRPGNRIDLLLSYKWKDPDTKQTTQRVKPLLEYIEVFAVDAQVYGVSKAGDNNKARNISLLVDTEQMLLLKIAQDKGSISTVLRSNEDKEELNVAEMSENFLDGGSRSVVNETSTVGFFDELKEPENGFALPEDGFAVPEEKTPVREMIAQLEPIEIDTEPEFWTMTIHEGGTRRRERVNLESEEPLYEPGGSYGPQPSAPTTAGLKPGTADQLPEGLNIDFGDEDLDDAASGLLDLLN